MRRPPLESGFQESPQKQKKLRNQISKWLLIHNKNKRQIWKSLKPIKNLSKFI